MALPQGEALSVQAALGEKIFNDASLSASGAQSCATCHVPEHKHSPANDFPAQFGGPLGNLQGTRSTPSIRYLLLGTPFFFDTDGTPTGGFFWDGRARNLAEQATEPFLNPFEMANDDKASVVRRLAAAPYSDEFRNVFGEAIFSDVDGAFMRMSLAVQQYEREERSFNSFSSKYDAFLRGATELNDQEMHGLALFNSPVKGNCAACHPSDRGSDGSMPLFTDSTYDNLGVPRNPELSRNADPQYFDLGLCQVPALASHEELCGAFKVPSLRNVAVREVYFHNGYFKSLKDVVTFYVQRDTDPEKWYPLNADGSVHKFDDLPPQYHSNVNAEEVPYNRQPGDAPALSESEIDDVLAFLRTLTDGYSP
ncbi:MAG: cytochrome-c peroxidase [Gammaproteobacteria bacterium]